MVVFSILPRAEFGPNDHREAALHFTQKLDSYVIKTLYLNRVASVISIQELDRQLRLMF